MYFMSKSTDKSKDIFAECRKNAEKFFAEIDKSTPVYHQVTTDIQKNYQQAWKNVIDSSIALQQDFADKAGLKVNMPEEAANMMQNMIERTITAYQNQNKAVYDSAEVSKKIFDVLNENTKIFSSLNKNMIEMMESMMNRYKQN